MILQHDGHQLFFMGIPHDAGHAFDPSDLLWSPLRITSRYNNFGPWILPVHPPDHLTGFGIGRMGDRAGVNDDDVRVFPVLGSAKMMIQERLLNGRPVRLRRPTAKIDDVKSLLPHFRDSEPTLSPDPNAISITEQI
jgi:hypothetical protein